MKSSFLALIYTPGKELFKFEKLGLVKERVLFMFENQNKIRTMLTHKHDTFKITLNTLHSMNYLTLGNEYISIRNNTIYIPIEHLLSKTNEEVKDKFETNLHMAINLPGGMY
jgi:hypothetical protein